MPNEITLLKLDDDADAIIATFADRTRLTERNDNGNRVTFAIRDAGDHQVDVVQTLTEIDARWTDHVGLAMPGG